VCLRTHPSGTAGPHRSPAGVVFRTKGSDFDTILAAYTGPTLTGLTQVATNDSSSSASRVHNSQLLSSA
jgi:hypothetical protein